MPEIHELPLFADLQSHRKEKLKQVAMLHSLKKGEIVFLPGDESDCVYVVAAGRIKISKLSETGKELTLAYYDAGELFGELSLLEDRPHRTVVVAVEPSEVWSIPSEHFLELARTSPGFALRLSVLIGKRRHELESRMESIVFRDVPARLAQQLLKLANDYGVENNGLVEITFKLSQLELANLIGATRETTSTALNNMKRAGILNTSHRRIVIRDMQALENIRDKI